MSAPALNWNIFVLSFGLLQGILLSFLLMQKKAHRNGYIFLMIYLMVILIQVSLKLMSKTWLMDHMILLYNISYQLTFLYGPLVFFFARQMLEEKPFKPHDILHFLPFIIAFLYLSGRFIHSPWLALALLNIETRFILQMISILVYHGLAFRMWKRHKVQVHQKIPEHQQLRFRWIRSFISISFAVCIIIAASNFLLVKYHPILAPARYGFAIFTLFIYWISYTAFKQPQVFYTVSPFGNDNSPENTLRKLVVYKPSKKYANSRLSQAEIERILKNVQTLMELDKLYLDPDISIDKLAELIPCSKHHLSQVLNEQMNKTFYEFINCYRVKEAQSLLLDQKRAEHKIASIAYDAGFNSLSAFNDVFRKLTGVTPSQFRSQACEQSLQQRV